jgi:2-aminobenzoate-CoA ligase
MGLSYPPRDLWPDRVYNLPELSYPESLNACYHLLDVHVEQGRGDSAAIHFNDDTITYGQLLDRVTALAATLRAEGVRPGERVLLRLLNRPHFIYAWLALVRIGAVVVATPPPIKARELQAVVESARPVLFVSEPELW